MEMNSSRCAHNSPYPEIAVSGRDRRYAEAMLSNIGSANSEMSAISLYSYNALITDEMHPYIAECFNSISTVEMHHLRIFLKLALQLGADPRLWTYSRGRPVYWSPGCNKYPTATRLMVENSLRSEEETIAKYREQAAWIEDTNIVAILKRIILDELVHIQIFKNILNDI